MLRNGKSSMPQMFISPRAKDRKVVLDALSQFDGFQVGASTPSASVSFVKDVGKPFFVDPMAYMFTLPPDAVIDSSKGKVRASLESLAHRYNALLARTVGKRSLNAGDLLDQLDVLEGLTLNVLEYQRTKLQFGELNLFNPYYDKYASLAREGDDVPHQNNAVTPWAVIPPYFFFTGSDDPWYRTTLRCARIAVKYKQPHELLYPTLFIGLETLDDPVSLARIASDFNDKNFDGIFVWVNNMEEASTNPLRLAALTSFVAALASKGKPVFKLYGGFFSILLHNKGLTGFSCSLSYKTLRNIFAYKWFAPLKPKAKFYVPLLHRSYKLEEADQILRMFPFLRCQCKVCLRTYGKNVDAFIEQMERPEYCERHFLNARKQEMQLAQKGTTAMLDSLNDTINRMGKKNAVGVRHLSKWRDVLRDSETVGVGRELLWKAKQAPRSHFIGA